MLRSGSGLGSISGSGLNARSCRVVSCRVVQSDVVLAQDEASPEAVTSDKAQGAGLVELGGRRRWRTEQQLRRPRSSVTARL